MTAACLLARSPACSARQLQTSIVQVVHLCPTGFRKEPCERLERHKPKGLRVVLRGLGSSNAPRLPADLWPQLFSDASCIALWISSEKILTRLYSVLHWFHKRLEANVKKPRENRCF